MHTNRTNKPDVRYVLLMRHASHEADPFNPGLRHLSKNGCEEVRQVGERLCEYLDSAHRYRKRAIERLRGDSASAKPSDGQIQSALKDIAAPRLGAVLCGESCESRATAHSLLNILRSRSEDANGSALLEPQRKSHLSPAHADTADPYVYHWVSRPEGPTEETIVEDDILKAKLLCDANAVLVVGHAPQLGWLARYLTNGNIPIRRGELLCIERTKNRSGTKCKWHLAWVLTPNVDSNAAKARDDELREKIRGKMESAKLLGAVFVGLLTFVIQAPKNLAETLGKQSSSTQLSHNIFLENWDLLISFGLGIGFFLIGAVLYFSAYFAYDSLLMPARFWAEGRPPDRRRRWLVQRPPSSATWVMYQNMQMIWNYRFTPAIISSVLAPGFLAYSLFAAYLLPGRNAVITFWVFIDIIVLVASIVYLYLNWTKPVLGAED